MAFNLSRVPILSQMGTHEKYEENKCHGGCFNSLY